MSAIDLTTFAPNSAEELFDGVMSEVAKVLIDNFNKFKRDVAVYLKSVSQKVWDTQAKLASGVISAADADIAVQTQELALSNIVLYAPFMTYVTAQNVLDIVFKVIGAAVRNLTGIDLNF